MRERVGLRPANDNTPLHGGLEALCTAAGIVLTLGAWVLVLQALSYASGPSVLATSPLGSGARQTLGHASVATTDRYLHARPTGSSARHLRDE